jgi:K+-sensing histidine kinase KdpD
MFTYDPIIGIKHTSEENLTETMKNNKSLESPIMFRGQALGSLKLKRADGEPSWTQTEIEFFHAIVAQLGLALENARMFEDTQEQAEREKLVGDISAKLWASADIDTIVRTTVEEIGSSLKLTGAVIELEVQANQ